MQLTHNIDGRRRRTSRRFTWYAEQGCLVLGVCQFVCQPFAVAWFHVHINLQLQISKIIAKREVAGM